MQHEVDAGARLPARVEVADVALDDPGTGPGHLADRPMNFVQVGTMARRKVVEHHDLLAALEQRLQQMRADESGSARHQPAARRVTQTGLEFVQA